MRAIANGQLEGFPSASEVRTVYVEHDIDSSLSDSTVFDFLMSDNQVMEISSPEEIIQKLETNGFDESMRNLPVGSLSGGWKM